MNNSPYISVVIPVLEEEANIQVLYGQVVKTLEPLKHSFELLFIDDGSKDRTFDILKRINSHDARAKVIRFRRNYGQTAATAAGFRFAQGEVIVTLDGDLQNDPADIPLLLSKLGNGYDIVCGWRKKRRDNFLTRCAPSMVANWLIRALTGLNIHDIGCSLRAYRSKIVQRMTLYNEMHRFIPALALPMGANISEVVVEHHRRHFGRSKYGLGRIWRVLLDLTTIKMITRFGQKPLLWFALMSVPFLTIGSFFLLFGIGGYLFKFTEEYITIFTMALIFLFLAGNFVALGIIGELCLTKIGFRKKKTQASSIPYLHIHYEKHKTSTIERKKSVSIKG